MRHARDQGAKAGQLLGLYEPLLSLLALRDVADDAAVEDRVLRLPRGQGQLQRKFAPVFLQPVQLDRLPDQAGVSVGAEPLDFLLVRLPIAGWYKEGERLALDLFH